MSFNRKSYVDRKLRRSFHTVDVTIDVEKGYGGDGEIRLIERGRSYVKALTLYEEELLWLQTMCWKEKRKYGGSLQLGRLRGGNRTLICSRLIVGGARKLELRLLAPYGKRQMCIPELIAGQGWLFFAEILFNFVQRKKAALPTDVEIFPTNVRSRMTVDTAPKKSYLQAASLPKWKLSGLICALVDGKEKHVCINYEDAVERSFQMSRCLLGSLGGSAYGKDDLAAVRRWMERTWKIPGGVELKEIDSVTFLLIFPSKELAEEKIGKHHVNGEPLLLDKWHSWGCCNGRGWNPNSIWVRVLGLPFFLWDKETFESIGDYCGGHLETAKETTTQSHLKWAKLRIKGNGRNVPALVKIKVGSTIYDYPIWVDRKPWVDWISNPTIPSDDRRPPRLEKMVAREAASSQSEVHALRRQRGRVVNGFRNSKKRSHYNPKNGKFRWIKVGDKVIHKRESHISNSINELPLFNRFEINNSLYDPMNLEITKDHDFNVAADNETWEDQFSEDLILEKTSRRPLLVRQKRERLRKLETQTDIRNH